MKAEVKPLCDLCCLQGTFPNVRIKLTLNRRRSDGTEKQILGLTKFFEQKEDGNSLKPSSQVNCGRTRDTGRPSSNVCGQRESARRVQQADGNTLHSLLCPRSI